LNYNCHGIIGDESLRDFISVADSLTYDAMHTYFQSGVCNAEMTLVLSRLKASGIKWTSVETFFKADFAFPGYSKRKGDSLHECFNEAREKSSKKVFKAGASEMLGIVPVFNHFLVLLPEPVKTTMADEVACFNKLNACIQLYKQAKGAVENDGDDGCHAMLAGKWMLAEKDHQATFCEVYGANKVKPKHHYRLHLPKQFQRDGIVLDCFPLERLYKTPKNVAHNFKNTKQFEKSVLTNTLFKSIKACEMSLGSAGLKGIVVANQSLRRALGCDDADFAVEVDTDFGLHIHAGPPPHPFQVFLGN
jgi:hypothetical protein